MMSRFPYANTALFLPGLLVGLFLFEGTAHPVFAELTPEIPVNPTLAPAAPAPPSINGEFLYIRAGRPDPFFPFLSQEIAKAEAKARSEATGTQKYDPGQLTLVAIIFAGRQPLAMVQDSAGVGYTVRKGDKIGQGGTVLDVLPGKLLVSQKVDSPGAQEKSRTIELILNTEGGK